MGGRPGVAGSWCLNVIPCVARLGEKTGNGFIHHLKCTVVRVRLIIYFGGRGSAQ